MLLLLHGALGDQTQFGELRPLLSGFDVHTLDFEGHGARPMAGRGFRLEHFADNVATWLDAHASAPVDIFGYSMGGYVALYLAATQPERVRSVFTLGTKLVWSNEIAAVAVAQLDPAVISAKVPAYAKQLEARHTATGWQRVLSETRDALRALGAAPLLTPERLAEVRCPVRLAVGDRDQTVSVEELRDTARILARGEYEVLPGTPHPFERAPLQRVAWTMSEFVTVARVGER